MYEVCAISTIHRDLDNRIYYRQLKVLSSAGMKCCIVAPWKNGITYKDQIDLISTEMPQSRMARIYHSFKTLRQAIKIKSSIYIFHDPDFILSALILKLVTKKVVIYDCHENIPEDILYGKPWIPSWLRFALSRIYKVFEEFCAKRFNAVMCVVPNQIERFDRSKANTFLFRNFCSLKIKPTQKKDFKKLIYMGTISKNYAADFLIELGREIKLRNKKYTITIPDYFGLDSSYKAHFLNIILTEKLPFIIKNPVSPDNLHELAGDCGIGLVMMEDTLNKRLAYPTKLFEYMKLEIFPVSMDFGYAKEILENGKLGELCQYGSAESWLAAFDRINDDRETREAKLQKIKFASDNLYSWEKEKGRFLNFISSIGNSKK